MYTVTLDCGTALSFTARELLPTGGDVVPCRRHGYCRAVRSSAPGAVSRTVEVASRRRRRFRHELLEFLVSRPETTVHVLRRRGFTLRVVAAAERDGLLDLDLDTGRVVLRR